MTYSTAQVSRKAHVSVRQLQWWDERRVLVPVQVSHRRLYTDDQLASAIKLGKMRRAGVSLQQARKLLRHGTPWELVVRLCRPTVIGGTLVVPR